ncbi:MAG: MaoC/PaaZ C-terminal domain-containing protein [Polyangiaceae bacterium]
MQTGQIDVGYTTETFEHEIDWKQAVTYALGIGATRNELDYLYEAKGPKVYPTFGVIPAYAPAVAVVGRAGGSFENLVHGSQSIVVHRPIPATGVLRTTARLEGLYNLKRMAQLVVSTRTEMDGIHLFDTTWMLILFDRGGFGGPRPPKTEKVEPEDGQAPDFVSSQRTSPEQAILYRLSGDTNPLHIDAQFAKNLGFEQGPILHGLCTFGLTGRAVVNGLLDGNADRLVELHAQFKKPVWPSETLKTVGCRVGGNRVALEVSVEERNEVVLGNAWAKIA